MALTNLRNHRYHKLFVHLYKSKFCCDIKSFMNFFVFLSIIFIFLPSLFVYGLNVSITPVRDSIYLNETAMYRVLITSDQKTTVNFDISPGLPEWSIFSDPMYVLHGNFDINKNFSFLLEIKPLGTKEPKLYFFTYNLYSTLENLSGNFGLKILSRPKISIYPLVLRTKVELSDFALYPNDVLKVNVLVENKNPRDVGTVQVKIKSKLFQAQRGIEIKPKTPDAKVDDYTKKLEFDFKVPEKQLPLEDTLVVQIFVNNSLYDQYNYKIAILPFVKKKIVENVSTKLLKATYYITVYNQGNIPYNFSIKKRINWFAKIFAKANDAKIVKENAEYYFVWNFSLKPWQQVTVVFTINYWPLVYLIIVLGVLIFIYLLFESPIDIEKKVVEKRIKDETIELKIHLYIRNLERKPLHDVVVYEKLPEVLSYVKKDMIGAMIPTKVFRRRDGTLLKWELSELEPLEERILVYHVKVNLAVVGKIVLPGAIVKYPGPFNRIYQIKSNEVEIIFE